MLSKNNDNITRIKSLIILEMGRISNPIIKNGLKNILIDPIQHLRKWDYGTKDEKFICWTVALDKNSDTSLIYSDYGFGPETPWGLVSESILCYGMDSGWFDNLKDCFLDSKMANELPIWEVEKKIDALNKETLADNLTLEEAFEKRDKVAMVDSKFTYNVVASDAAI